jgi:hypothetical protein
MALFKTNPINAGDPGMCVVAGSVVASNTSTGNNTIVPQAMAPATANAAGAAIGQGETIAPQASKVTVVFQPTTAYHPAVATNANTAGVALLDLRAYPSDIVSVQVTLANAPGATPGTLVFVAPTATVVGIDQVNKFVYIASSQNFVNNLALHYVVYFKDTYVP